MTLTRRQLMMTPLAFGLGAMASSASAEAAPFSDTSVDASHASHDFSRLEISTAAGAYWLFLFTPRGEPPPKGWRSLWMLDGNSVFDRLSPELLAAHPDVAVIAVGYPAREGVDLRRRTLDYTPATAGSNVDPRHPDRQTGGDASFRTALTGPLRQAVEERMPLDPARRTLWGHSYGGLFTISTLFASPESFRCWVPVSPSTGFGEGALFVAERTARRVPGGIAPVHILLGDRERRRNSSAASTPAPSPQTMALVERLGERPDLAVRVTVLEGLGHGATFAASFPAAFAAGAV
ncbi:alpha/beta hydrolase [Haematobacter genomosp. 1]|nr:alpha/beta hydrolase-fold protein [Haematobacter genomosp. 1]